MLCLSLILALTGTRVTAQPKAPELAFVARFNVTIGQPYIVGETAHGLRRIIPITGGTIEGPQLKGTILPGGADWQIVRKDGVAEVEAHYQFRTDDGVTVYIKNVGLRVATPEVAARIGRGEQVSPSEYYFRTAPKFEAPAGKYAWLNDALYIANAFRNPDNVVIEIWQVR
ncbi:hypothetical protein BLX24_07750 [Arsenicibacter rosenii]|uniref:UPF0311 protein BLX24_07750 n=2 Tax=Arsenicibacter rosenii TaxID=1750698 RepID=A0A1S2VP42_9BACT|nr:hypothetical protein BLX24_07750 [Arsenicibacter rosenii]